MKIRYLILPLIMALAACSSTPTTTTKAAPVEDRSVSSTTDAASTSTQSAGDSKVTAVNNEKTTVVDGEVVPVIDKNSPLHDPKNILFKRTVLFDYDSFVVREESRPLVEAHAKFLRDHKNYKVVLEGHTDERGSTEYNIALGQKRADAVRRMMVLLGATDGQIETVSYGKEKPKADGHDESAWSQNRRSEIRYLSE